MSQDLITADLVVLDVDLGPTKNDVIHNLAELVAKAGRADASGLEADALAREAKAATGLGGGIAIPHCRSAAVTTNSLAFARLSPPVDFGAFDGPADIAFMIAAAEGSDDAHLELLALLARNLVRAEFTDGLRNAATPDDVVALVNAAIHPEEEAAPAAAAAAPAAAAASDEKVVLVAVTACPTGIAHTFMSADALEQAAKAAGVELHVEPQGSGKVTPIDPAIIAGASAAIFATDVGVRDKERFAGLPVIESGVKRAINEPAKMIEEAVAAAKDPNARKVSGDASSAAASAGGSQLSVGKRIQQALMTGVSYMIPFVAAGGLMIALGFAMAGFDIALAPGVQGARTCDVLPFLDPATCAAAQAAGADGDTIGSLIMAAGWNAGFMNYIGFLLFTIGGAAFGFLLPALSGYIAFGLAGRPGIAPGFVGGVIAGALGAGFLGALVTGLLAGVIALWMSNWNVPRWLAGLMPVVIIPLLVTAAVGLIMYLLLGSPLKAITDGLTNGLNGMAASGAGVFLGLVLGLMMCFDLGGPVNKAAYLFATAGLAAQTDASFQIMAAVMCAGMVPPLALALATTVRSKLFTEVELENGRAAWLLGAAFISEGAIPFAASDPLRVIPSMMLGGAVTGSLSMALAVGSRAPHGGLLVVPLMTNALGFLIALIAGVIVAGIAVIAAKQFWPVKQVATA
ncbi:fructose-specific PTS transporter subunit EIIC [Micropruina sp.]|uniref:PTS fructose transporter subunit IIABC n=1 Tax=Micropruina sp. TaxID=2737536 RepID=UPI002636D1A4|nr:fructose-specific PTS transporter subunit EIIC [Micropruina sp.]